jgi:hypothetical protein
MGDQLSYGGRRFRALAPITQAIGNRLEPAWLLGLVLQTLL